MSGQRILALAAAVLLGVIGGVVVGRATAPDPPPPAGLATSQVADLLASRVSAVNDGDKESIAIHYSTNAVVEEHDQDPPVIYSGNERIASVLSGYQLLGFRIQQQGVAMQQGSWVAEPLTWSNGEGIAVYEIDDDGVIAHQWVFGE